MPGTSSDLVASLGPILDLRNSIPESLGLRRYTITRRRRTWDSGEVGLGTPTDSDLTLTPTPKLEELQGDQKIRLSMITPYYAGPPSGGYTREQLVGTDVAGVEEYYSIEGTNGTHSYVVVAIDTSGEGSSMRYTLTLETLTRATPF